MKRLTVFFAACFVFMASCTSPVGSTVSPTVETTVTSATVSEPIILPSGGKILTTDTISIKCDTSGATIVYTIDGTDPTESSTKYILPIQLSQGTVIVKTLAYKTGSINSSIVSSTFIVSTPAATVVTAKKYVYNSDWYLVKTYDVIVLSTSKSIMTISEIDAEIAAHNSVSINDHYFIEDVETPIDLAPTAEAWIVNASSFYVYQHYTGILRENVTNNRNGWRLELSLYDNAVAYIDVAPPDYVPPPVVIDARTDYEKYAIYEVNSDYSIYFETHCEDYDSDTMNCTKNIYFQNRLASISLGAYGTTRTIVSGRIYTPPTP
jgi:hypothetical protein